MNHVASRPTRLLIRPKHVQNESLRGYVSRVSSCNGSSSLLKPMLVSLQVTTNAIQEIATLTGCNDTLLRLHGSYMQIHDDGHSRVLFGSCILSTDQVWGQRRMICPQCLSINGVSICCWELRDYDVCHEHGCYMVSRCSGCNREINWLRATSEKCSCGIRLTDIKTKLASITRKLICKLIADAMSESVNRSKQREIISDSLTPLNWLFIVSNFVLSILIPGFCQEHLGKICAISNQTSEELLSVILKDSEYYDYLRKFISLHTFRNQFTMVRALRAGISDNAMRENFLPYYRNIPLHEHFFKIKCEVLEKRKLDLQRGSDSVAQAQERRSESHYFQ